jgi:hypothetical protein
VAGLAAVAAEDTCAICGRPISGPVYMASDSILGEQFMVCSNCVMLPRCFRCGRPVWKDGLTLPDGRHLCARDAKAAVLDINEARRICDGVADDLDRLFSRYTSFPTNVDVSVIDRIDVDEEFETAGHAFESPDILGWTIVNKLDEPSRFKIGLLGGLPAASLKAVCAHELSHTWAAVNVPPARHERMARDAEEGFCEMVAYLLMDSQREDEQKKFILRNHYTRGQVQLFLEAERQYGFDQILDWMQYGETAQLEPGRLDKLRDVQMPVENRTEPKPAAATRFPAQFFPVTNTDSAVARTPSREPDTIELQGILWAKPPAAVINGQTVFAGDRFKLKLNGTNVNVRCVKIRKDSVVVENTDSGKRDELHWRNN